MGLLVYNTLARAKEKFVPMHGKKVNMFVCGQTPYDDAHVGHARGYIVFDTVVRWLRHKGYDVEYIQNITDIEDKIINRAKERETTPEQLERHYEKRFLEDMDMLGVKKNIDEYPRSHDYIDAMRDQIQILLDKGFAYAIDGDIYYNVAKFKDYTRLSGMKLEELEKHRIEPNPKKINVYDFSLWKAAKAGEPTWRIKLKVNGKEQVFSGRPGWHIEDTAMTYSFFGPQYDLHGGGSDLIFPHHTNEIAQAEAAYGKRPFVKYWMHSEVLNMKGVKMSKSLKNFVTIRDALKSYSAEALRLLALSTHYRKGIDYDDVLMKDATKRLSHMYIALSIFYNMKTGKGGGTGQIIDALARDFSDAMDDDFNTPLALSALMRSLNQLRSYAESHESVGAEEKDEVMKEVLGLAATLGVLEKDTYKVTLPEEALFLMKRRDELRKRGDFKEADKIRAQLKEGYKIGTEDTEYGTIWYMVG